MYIHHTNIYLTNDTRMIVTVSSKERNATLSTPYVLSQTTCNMAPCECWKRKNIITSYVTSTYSEVTSVIPDSTKTSYLPIYFAPKIHSHLIEPALNFSLHVARFLFTQSLQYIEIWNLVAFHTFKIHSFRFLARPKMAKGGGVIL
jgi:hypothetical protein